MKNHMRSLSTMSLFIFRFGELWVSHCSISENLFLKSFHHGSLFGLNCKFSSVHFVLPIMTSSDSNLLVTAGILPDTSVHVIYSLTQSTNSTGAYKTGILYINRQIHLLLPYIHFRETSWISVHFRDISQNDFICQL